MPRKLPPFVERWRDRHGKMRHYFRKGKGARFPLPWSRDGRVRSGLSSRSYGATCSEAMRPSPKSLQQLVQWIRKLFVERGSQ